MRIALMTDLHFVPAGRRLYGLDPRARLEAALADLATQPPVELILITGDLAHRGEPAAYESLAEVLAGAPAPVWLMMGNHDLRGPFREVFPEADDDGAGFVQGMRASPDATLITLDTLDEERDGHAGRLCPRRLAFLERALGDAPRDRPLLLLQHHPPFMTGLPGMDRIRLTDHAEEAAVIARTRQPDLLVMGHVHRPISGVWQGIPYHIQRGLNHQVDYRPDLTDGIAGTHEVPDYSLVTVAAGDIQIHQISFLYDGPRFLLHDKAAEAADRLA